MLGGAAPDRSHRPEGAPEAHGAAAPARNPVRGPRSRSGSVRRGLPAAMDRDSCTGALGAEDPTDATAEGHTHDMHSRQRPRENEDPHGGNPTQQPRSQDLRLDARAPPRTQPRRHEPAGDEVQHRDGCDHAPDPGAHARILSNQPSETKSLLEVVTRPGIEGGPNVTGRRRRTALPTELPAVVRPEATSSTLADRTTGFPLRASRFRFVRVRVPHLSGAPGPVECEDPCVDRGDAAGGDARARSR